MKIEIEVSQENYDSIWEFLKYIKDEEHQSSTHGQITFKGLAEMLLEDVALAVRRPGSWEGSNMRQVLNSHGYTHI